MKSRIDTNTLVEKAENYLALSIFSEEKVEAFRTILNHEIDAAFKERRFEDYERLHRTYHKLVMSVPA